jgi:hypothetical protein
MTSNPTKRCAQTTRDKGPTPRTSRPSPTNTRKYVKQLNFFKHHHKCFSVFHRTLIRFRLSFCLDQVTCLADEPRGHVSRGRGGRVGKINVVRVDESACVFGGFLSMADSLTRRLTSQLPPLTRGRPPRPAHCRDSRSSETPWRCARRRPKGFLWEFRGEREGSGEGTGKITGGSADVSSLGPIASRRRQSRGR